MSGKSMMEQMEEFEAAWRAVGRSVGDALAETRLVRLMVRAALWIDAKVPRLARLDRLPRWMKFGTSEFFLALGVLYLVILMVVLIVTVVAEWIGRAIG